MVESNVGVFSQRTRFEMFAKEMFLKYPAWKMAYSPTKAIQNQSRVNLAVSNEPQKIIALENCQTKCLLKLSCEVSYGGTNFPSKFCKTHLSLAKIQRIELIMQDTKKNIFNIENLYTKSSLMLCFA
jgi:uncharacterized metal-binding protein